MPTYQYTCTECSQPLEAVQSFSDQALSECPACQGKLRKVFNSVGIVFKGSGFYRNDSRAGAAGSESPGSESKPDAKTDAKADSPTTKDSSSGTSESSGSGGTGSSNSSEGSSSGGSSSNSSSSSSSSSSSGSSSGSSSSGSSSSGSSANGSSGDVPGVAVTLKLPAGARLIDGEPSQQLGQLAGRTEHRSTASWWGYAPGTPDRAFADWIVAAPAGTAFTAKASHERAGSAQAELVLGAKTE